MNLTLKTGNFVARAANGLRNRLTSVQGGIYDRWSVNGVTERTRAATHELCLNPETDDETVLAICTAAVERECQAVATAAADYKLRAAGVTATLEKLDVPGWVREFIRMETETDPGDMR